MVSPSATPAGPAEGAGLRVIQLGRADKWVRGPALASGDEDTAVGQKGGGVAGASARHRAGGAEDAGTRVIQLG